MKLPQRQPLQSIVLGPLLALLLISAVAIRPAHADTDTSDQLGDAGLRSALRSAGLADDAAAPWTPDRITIAALYFDPSMRTARWTAQRWH